MGISDTTSKISYSGNGSTTAFSFPFKVFNDTQLKVILVSSAGVETEQTFQTHYTATVNSDEGGIVTMVTAPATGETLFIKRNIPNTQPTSLGFGPLPKAELEEMSDRSTLQIQQLEEKMSRTPTLPETTSIENPSIEEPSTGKMPRWDASGNLVNSTYTESEMGAGTVASINTSTGSSDAGKNISTDDGGRLDPTFWNYTRSISASETLTNYDRVVYADATSGQVTASLPASPAKAGQRIKIIRSDNSTNSMVISGNGNTINNAFNSGVQYRLYKQFNFVEVLWNGATWDVIDVNVQHIESDNYDDQAFIAGSSRDTWYVTDANFNVTLKSWSEWRVRLNGIIRCSTSTTDPVDISVGIADANNSANIFEERFVGRLGSDNAVDRFGFEFTLKDLVTVDSTAKQLYIFIRANTVTGTPTISNFSLYHSNSGAPNDDGANIVAERVR